MPQARQRVAVAGSVRGGRNRQKGMVEQYGRWAYDNPKFLIANVALGVAYPQTVNHDDTPYVGLPESTVDSIKSGSGQSSCV
jgi:hypothetical protein